MSIDSVVGFTDWSQTEVVRPSDHHPVEFPYQCRCIQLGGTAFGFFANSSTDALHSLLRRYRAQIGASGPRRVATPKRVPQKVELLFWQRTDPRLRFVHRQLQLRHHVPHRGQSLFGSATTADHEIIGIVDDVRLESLLVPQLHPAEHEPAHVQVAEQGADRRSLRSTPTLIPIARTTTLIAAFVGFFYGSVQPHLDQMQHGSIDDPSSYRLE